MCDKELRLDGETGQECFDRVFSTDPCCVCGHEREWHKLLSTTDGGFTPKHWIAQCAIPEEPTRMYRFKLSELPDEWEVGCCNMEHWWYVYAESREKALELIESGDAGMCAECMCDLLAESGILIGHALPEEE